MSALTSDDLAALAQQDMLTLAHGWGALNSWKWPEWLPDPESAGDFDPGHSRRSIAMRWIEEAVGMRACFRYNGFWKERGEEEFNDFWRGCFEGHKPSRDRYYKRLADQVSAASA